jgi:hypothetical protein
MLHAPLYNEFTSNINMRHAYQPVAHAQHHLPDRASIELTRRCGKSQTACWRMRSGGAPAALWLPRGWRSPSTAAWRPWTRWPTFDNFSAQPQVCTLACIVTCARSVNTQEVLSPT